MGLVGVLGLMEPDEHLAGRLLQLRMCVTQSGSRIEIEDDEEYE